MLAMERIATISAAGQIKQIASRELQFLTGTSNENGILSVTKIINLCNQLIEVAEES